MLNALNSALPPRRLTSMSLKPFSQEWADSLREILNADAAFQESTKSWRWQVALVLAPSPEVGLPDGGAVQLDLDRGSCNAAESKSPDAVTSDYVLRGDWPTWKGIVQGDDAITAVTTGRLKPAKGNLFSLMTHVAAARALVDCARRVDTEL